MKQPTPLPPLDILCNYFTLIQGVLSMRQIQILRLAESVQTRKSDAQLIELQRTPYFQKSQTKGFDSKNGYLCKGR